MKFLLIFVSILVLCSCGSAVSVDYDYKTNFSVYKSYNYFPDIASNLSELDDKRIIHTTDSILQSRGLIKSHSPQILVNFFADEIISNSRNTIGIGVGGGGRNVGFGVSGGIPIGGTMINQTLTIDFIDANADELIWQAKAEGKLKEKASPSQKDNYYVAIIDKILKRYPPKR